MQNNYRSNTLTRQDLAIGLLPLFEHCSFIEALLETKGVLKGRDSLFFQIDYCKVLPDQIFGRDCFLNEIIGA